VPETRRRNWAIGIGILLTFLGAFSYFTVFARFPAFRDVPWVNLPVVLLGLVLSVLGAWRAWRRPDAWRGRFLGSVGVVLSALLAAGFLAYVFVLSYQVPAPSSETLGLEVAPELELVSTAGDPVRLSEFRGRKVVLVFYRGFW
jgi:hypothetical protein